MNTIWHTRNKLPRNASLEKRIAWHTQHQKECGCRPIPVKLLEEIKKKK